MNYSASVNLNPIDLAKRDICPECGGQLDTGWECNRCGYDAKFLLDDSAGPIQ